jgi:hypothetical protein
MLLTAEKLTLAPNYIEGHVWAKSRGPSMAVMITKLIDLKLISFGLVLDKKATQ